MKNIRPNVSAWTKPIIVGRRAHGTVQKQYYDRMLKAPKRKMGVGVGIDNSYWKPAV